MKLKTILPLTGILLAAVLVVIVSQGGDDSTDESVAGDVQAVTNGAPFSALNFDYEPVHGPSGVARRVETAPGGGVVVRGQIEDYRPGRTYMVGPPEHTVVMSVKVNELYSGKLPDGSEGKVYVELDGPEESQMTEFLRGARANAPVGTEGIFYLWHMPEGGIHPGARQLEPNAGRPDGEPLYRPIPQGVFLANPDADAVISPSENAVYPGSELSEFSPANSSFPEGSKVASGT